MSPFYLITRARTNGEAWGRGELQYIIAPQESNSSSVDVAPSNSEFLRVYGTGYVALLVSGGTHGDNSCEVAVAVQ